MNILFVIFFSTVISKEKGKVNVYQCTFSLISCLEIPKNMHKNIDVFYVGHFLEHLIVSGL